jgi:hypothetical protein
LACGEVHAEKMGGGRLVRRDGGRSDCYSPDDAGEGLELGGEGRQWIRHRVCVRRGDALAVNGMGPLGWGCWWRWATGVVRGCTDG